MDTKSKFYVIILAAGYGTRLKPLSNKIPKPLIDINGKPLISRVISNFEDAGFNKFCVILGYKKSLIREELNKFDNVDILISEQTDPSGMADAIELAIKEINQKNDKERYFNYFITAADILFPKEEILKIYNLFVRSKSEMVLSLMRSTDQRIAKGHGNVKIADEANLSMDNDINNGLRIVDIIEKPSPHQILSEYYSLPLYLADQQIINYLESVKISERGEKEFQDAIKAAISRGEDIRGIKIINKMITAEIVGKYHLTDLKDIIKMNNRFLTGLEINNIRGELPKMIEPVLIKADSRIGKNVSLGPYVIIGKSCNIGDLSDLSNAIILNQSTLGMNSKLEWCIIDENVNVPEDFKAKNCFITMNDREELEIIKI